jgi:regulatory protein
MHYLARREHSRAELRNRLLPHVQEGEDVDAVLDELTARNWLSDARAAEQMLNQRRTRFGAQRITHELRQKGIGDDLIEDVLPKLKETEIDTARDVWRKKFGTLPKDQKEKAKQARFLQSRGFAIDTILKVLQTSGSEDF